jgi:uracil-DNA glycosylase family 4
MDAQANLAELLQWYADIGVDEAMGYTPIDRTVLAKASVPEKAAILPLVAATPAPLAAATVPAAAIPGAIEALKEATVLAAGVKTIDELKAALENFKGLSLKRTATQMVFADGPATARVMVIGDAPGADEDRAGHPFVGANGQLLDKMLGAIGLSREINVYLTNIINWRTPGNRTPSQSEIDLSLPFFRRHIELVNPAMIICIGGSAAKILLETKEPVSRLRGKWQEYKSIPTTTIFHPEFLLQQPTQKKVAWEDLQMVQVKLKELGIL